MLCSCESLPCSLVGGYQRFGGIYCFNPQDRNENIWESHLLRASCSFLVTASFLQCWSNCSFPGPMVLVYLALIDHFHLPLPLPLLSFVTDHFPILVHFYVENGGSIFPRNVVTHLSDYKSYTPEYHSMNLDRCENLKSHTQNFEICGNILILIFIFCF
jgi:hypothetical protein